MSANRPILIRRLLQVMRRPSATPSAVVNFHLPYLHEQMTPNPFRRRRQRHEIGYSLHSLQSRNYASSSNSFWKDLDQAVQEGNGIQAEEMVKNLLTNDKQDGTTKTGFQGIRQDMGIGHANNASCQEDNGCSSLES